jgi:antagonist of KipI
MSIQIIKAGLLDTIQDKGRYGFQHLGMNPSGAMDKYSMQMANILVGNNPEEAVIEMHFPASVFLFRRPALIALAGADYSATINGDAVAQLHPVWVNKNDVLQFERPVHGARAYLAISGGLGIRKWLGSYSTNLKAKAGGYHGRNLQKGDEILFRRSFPSPPRQSEFIVLPWKADDNREGALNEIWVLPGHEWRRLTTEAKENFTMTSFVITQQADRMGYRLNNIPLTALNNEELVSAAVCFGTVQLLPDGKLIILMADHQATGGYPRIAHAITAHHTKLAQLKAGDKIQFRVIDQATAENLYQQQQLHLQQLQNACTFRLEQYFNELRY